MILQFAFVLTAIIVGARLGGIELEIIEETPMNGLIEFHSLNIEEP